MIERSEDVSTLARLRRAWVEENDGPIDDPEFETCFGAWWGVEEGRRLVWVARVDGEAVGMLNLAEFLRMPRPGRRPARWGYVANVFVLAAHRNAGLGGQLIETAIAEARERDYVRLVLAPSERSEPLYRRYGFRDADELLVLPLT